MTIQGSPEWFADRAGKVTASRIADVMAKTRSGESASRANYRAQLVAERLTGIVEPSYTNAAMQWGVDNEPIARATYETRYGIMVDEVGFVPHSELMAGASPDGLVGVDGLIEIKCPNTATHIDYTLTKSIPEKYRLQMIWQMICTGRKWCDFVSFDPRMPDLLSMLVIRFEYDEKLASEVTEEVQIIIGEVDKTIAQLKSYAKSMGNGERT